ncbi:MAG: methyltransferase domain-containing protein, partial [Dehalococcoidales bacterium]
TSFLMMFGLVGLAFYRQSKAGIFVSIIGASAAGVASVWIIGRLFILSKKLKSSGTIQIDNAVGAQGKVVITDIRPELHRKTGENTEIRRHNILTDELERDYYNLVHCRSVLVHLDKPEKALTNMAKAVKPGGWLLIEELDNLTLPSFDSNNPDADIYYRFLNKAGQIQIRLRYIDVEFGSNVRRLVDQLSFEDIGSEGITMIVRGGEPWAQFEVMTYQALADRLKNELTEEEKKLLEESMEKTINLLENPSFYHVSYPLFSAWGRKPK